MIAEKAKLIHDMQEELFRKTGSGWYRVVSGSMQPLIDIGDCILVRRNGVSGVLPGDIVLFKQQNVFITHRVIKIYRRNGRQIVLQKGDAAGWASPIALDAILGKVVAIEKSGRVYPLEKGRLRVLNGWLKFKNSRLFRINVKFRMAKDFFRDKPGYRYFQAVYRLTFGRV